MTSLRIGDQHGPGVPDDLVAARRQLGGHRPGHGHQRPAQLGGMPGGAERAAAQRGLDHHGATARGGDHAIADQESRPARSPVRRPFTDQRAAGRDGLEQLVVPSGVAVAEPAGQHRDGGAAGRERGAVGPGVDAVRAAGDDGPAALGQRGRHLAAYVRPVTRGRARPDHRHRAHAGAAQVGVALDPQQDGAGVAERVELGRPVRVPGADGPDAGAVPRGDPGLGRDRAQPRRPSFQRPVQPADRRLTARRRGRPGTRGACPAQMAASTSCGAAGPQQRAEHRVAGIGHAAQRGPGEPLVIARGGHRATPSQSPSA